MLSISVVKVSRREWGSSTGVMHRPVSERVLVLMPLAGPVIPAVRSVLSCC